MADLNEKALALGKQPSEIRKLFEYGNQRAAEVGRENVFDFSLGNPSIDPPKKVDELVIQLEQTMEPAKLHGYTSGPGEKSVREAMSENVNRRFGRNSTFQNFYITTGAAAGLCIILSTLTADPSDEFVAVAPFFPEYKVFTEAAGAKFVIAEADEKEFQIQFEALEKAFTPHTRGIIINTPNNPSGSVLRPDTVEKLVAFLRNKMKEYGHPIYLISDEPYRELVYDAETRVPFFPNEYEYSIVCYSFSKSLSIPGERIGYLYVPEDIEDSADIFAAVCGAARALGYVCAPAMLQRVAAECADLTSDLNQYRENRDLLYNSLVRMGYSCIHPDGAFYLFVKAPGGNARAFSERAKGENLLLVPSDSFGCKGYLRLAYCVKKEMIERSLPAFERLIREY